MEEPGDIDGLLVGITIEFSDDHPFLGFTSSWTQGGNHGARVGTFTKVYI